jgi:hypothetical protein
MKLTTKQLKQMIREELAQSVLVEGPDLEMYDALTRAGYAVDSLTDPEIDRNNFKDLYQRRVAAMKALNELISFREGRNMPRASDQRFFRKKILNLRNLIIQFDDKYYFNFSHVGPAPPVPDWPTKHQQNWLSKKLDSISAAWFGKE